MLVGEDVALVVVNDSGALALRRLLAEAEHAAALGARGRDVHHTGVRHLVELVDRQSLGARDGQRRADRGHRGGGGHGLRAPAARDDGGDDGACGGAGNDREESTQGPHLFT